MIAKGSDTNGIEVRLEPDEFFQDEVRETFNYLQRTDRLASTQDDLLHMQAIHGRAQNGVWELNGDNDCTKAVRVKYPNATIEDVCIALGIMSVQDMHARRQMIIRDVRQYFNRALDCLKNGHRGNLNPGKHAMTLENRGWQPLGSVEFFRGVLVDNPKNLLIGAYIGGCIDNADWRTRTEERYGITMHKGVHVAVHLKTMMQHGITLADISNPASENPPTLDDYVKQGVISDRKREKYKDGFVSGYYHFQRGFGVSDDAAFLATALLFGIDAAYGFFLMDMIDTLDKSTSIISLGGMDEKIAREDIYKPLVRICEKEGIGFADDDILSIIYLSAIDDVSKNMFPSCSHRYFLKRDSTTGLYPLQCHVVFADYVTGGRTRRTPDISIAFQQINTRKFYGAFRERYLKLREMGALREPYTLPPNSNGELLL